MKAYVTGTSVICKVMSLEHLSQTHLLHEGLCHWNMSYAKLCHWNTCHRHTYYMKGYVTGTLVTCRAMSMEHLSHAELCQWNTCHMNSYVTGTFVTFIHLAKEISGSKNAVQLATLMSSAQYHMTPTWLARKQMIAAAKMLF